MSESHSGFCFFFSGLSEKTNHFLEKNRGQGNHIKVRLMTVSSYFNDFNLSKKEINPKKFELYLS